MSFGGGEWVLSKFVALSFAPLLSTALHVQITRSALLDYFATVFYWGATGAILAVWLGHGDRVSFYLFLAGLACNLLDWLGTGFAYKKSKDADHVDALRFRGLHPREGEGSDDDVRKLKAAGEKLLAVKLFRELHGADLKTAKAAVDAL